MEFKLERHQINKISRDKIIEELEKVAKTCDYTDFTEEDFNKVSEISYFTVNREFGSWKKVKQFLIEHLKNKGIQFKIATRGNRHDLKDIFEEMERSLSID